MASAVDSRLAYARLSAVALDNQEIPIYSPGVDHDALRYRLEVHDLPSELR